MRNLTRIRSLGTGTIGIINRVYITYRDYILVSVISRRYSRPILINRILIIPDPKIITTVLLKLTKVISEYLELRLKIIIFIIPALIRVFIIFKR